MDHQDQVICPHCKNEIEDSWKLFTEGVSEVIIECEQCERDYIAFQEFAVAYATAPI